MRLRIRPYLSAKAVVPLLYILLLFVLLGCGNNDKAMPPEAGGTALSSFNDLDFSAIQSGDIILKRGKGSLSNMIVKKLAEKVPLSHCGILIRDKDSLYVIHSVAKELTGIDGVQRVDFDTFLKDCVKGCLYVVRYRGDRDKQEQVAEMARNYLSRQVPFDYEINYQDSAKVNCSELVYQALLRSSGKDLFKRIKIQDKYPIAFNSLLDTARFEIIYKY